MLGRKATGVILEYLCEETSAWRKTIHFKQGLHKWEQASAIIRNPLQMDPPRMAVEEIRLTLIDLSGASGVQQGLWADPKKIKWRRLQEVEKRLRTKMPADHILHRVVNVAPWHPAPEMRSVQVPIYRSDNYRIKPMAAPIEVSVQESRYHRPVAVRLRGKWRPGHRGGRPVDLRPVVAAETDNPNLLPAERRGWADRSLSSMTEEGTAGISRGAEDGTTGRRGSGFRLCGTHAKSFYSFGVGASHVHELLAQAKQCRYSAMALTDTNLCGALEFAPPGQQSGRKTDNRRRTDPDR